ncbi:MAG: hypothetical protein E7L42_12560, partial [Staphylococcus lugdunensis]|nr:hypothetical protein [Staphylococcus lugdunensis]
TFTLILKRVNFGKIACEAGCPFENVRGDQPDGLEKAVTFSTGSSGLPRIWVKGKFPCGFGQRPRFLFKKMARQEINFTCFPFNLILVSQLATLLTYSTLKI